MKFVSKMAEIKILGVKSQSFRGKIDIIDFTIDKIDFVSIILLEISQ
jgi:hypothetical protein